MNIREIVRECRDFGVIELREVSDDYGELVFLNTEIASWEKVLAKFFGPPAKPRGQAAAKEDLSLTEEFGGLYNDQTLYKVQIEKKNIIAMLWPWQDNTHTTIKIILLQAA